MDLPNGLPDILSSMLQNPEIMKTVSALAENISLPSNEGKQGDESSIERAAPAGSAAGGLNIPPELLAQLPSIMSALSGSERSSSDREQTRSSPSSDNQRKALLSALKPFLSEKRCAVIDSLLKFESLTGVISGFTDKKT